jgi:hypothetical protein
LLARNGRGPHCDLQNGPRRIDDLGRSIRHIRRQVQKGKPKLGRVVSDTTPLSSSSHRQAHRLLAESDPAYPHVQLNARWRVAEARREQQTATGGLQNVFNVLYSRNAPPDEWAHRLIADVRPEFWTLPNPITKANLQNCANTMARYRGGVGGLGNMPAAAAIDNHQSKQAPPLEVFIERCLARASLVASNMMDLPTAVDSLQEAAERTGLVDELGQDAVQKIMSEAFGLRWRL